MATVRNVNGVSVLALAASMMACAVERDDEPRSEVPQQSSQSTVVGCCGAPGSLADIDGLRLTIQSGVAVPSGDATPSNQVRVAPFTSATIAIFDGGTWVARTADPLPSATSLGTANTIYDVFAWWSGTEVRLELVPWPSALTLQDGVQVKSTDATRRYLGVVASDGSGNFNDQATNRFVWNRYNQVPRPIAIIPSPSSTWTHTNPNGGWRSAAADLYGPVKVIVGAASGTGGVGIGGAFIAVQAQSMGYPTNVASGWIASGIGVDSSTVNSAQVGDLAAATSTPSYGHSTASYEGYLETGLHTIRWLETGSGTGVNYFFLGAPWSPAFGRTGLVGSVTM